VFNKAIGLDYISIDAYPFKKFKVAKFDCTTEKRAIEKDDIKKILAVELDPNDKNLNFARDLFVFSYFCGGINFVDMAYLTRENIVDEQITYKRKKTGVKVTIPLTTETSQIINRYDKGQGYIFPIFDPQRHKTPQQQENRRHKVLAQVNQKMREVGKIAGLKENLTSYVARHTFATTLFKSATNLGLISQTMGHKNLKTTQIYFASINIDEKKEAFKNLL
jgi:integrase